MKTSFCISLFLVLSFSPIQAQDLKGRFLVTGGLNFNFQNNDDFKSERFGIKPTALYFFSNRFAAGLETNFEFFNSRSYGLLVSEGYVVSFGPTLRYIPFKKERFGVFLDLKSLFSFTSSKSGPIERQEQELFSQNLLLSPGFFYQATPRIWLEANMNGLSSSYRLSQRTNGKEIDVKNGFNLNGDFSLSIFSVKVGFLLRKSKTTE